MGADSHSLKALPAADRPCERLWRLGPEALSDAELLAILLHTGTPSASALDLAQRLLRHGEASGGAVRFLQVARPADLAEVSGIGSTKAARIKAAVELGRRAAAAEVRRSRIRCAADAAGLLMGSMRHLEQEEVRVLCLDTRLGVLGLEGVALGGLNAARVEPREVFRPAVRCSAAAVIVAHNHPSGDPAPSQSDRQLTRRLLDAGRLLGIDLLDHVIIGDGTYHSLRDSAPQLWQLPRNRSARI